MDKAILTKDIRKTIDPNHTLPEVEIVSRAGVKPRRGKLVTHPLDIMSGEDKIGRATFVENTGKDKEAWFNSIELNDDMKGKGFGLATYIAAIERAHGKQLDMRTHDWSQTEAAVKVWTKFLEAGIAEVVEPFVTAGTLQNGKEIYAGHTVIPVPPVSTT